MIIPTNINSENHTADFRCDVHGGSVTALNLNTDAEYVGANNEVIKVSGSKLTSACDCEVYFPTANGNEDAQAIAVAKTE